MENQNELKWHQKPTAIIILLILFFPVGLYFMWKNDIWSKKTRWIISGICCLILIGQLGGSGSSGKPKACDCVDIIYEGPQMNWSGKDETDDAMMAKTWGWSKEKFNKWKECRNAYPGNATVSLECDKAKFKDGVKEIDENKILTPNIGTSSGYIWESINNEAQIYTTLAFDDLIFRTTVYSMNGKTNSEDFTKVIELSGSWNALDNKNAKGVISSNNVAVTWVFSDDFSSLTNTKGVIFKRIKV